MAENNLVTIRVKSNYHELIISIPATPRQFIGMEHEGTGTNTLAMLKQMVQELKELEENEN